MSIVRNRELSQFGSFIFIDDPTQSIGIATESTPYIGIGTPSPAVKLHIVGDTNIGGNLTVTGGTIDGSAFSINGNPLVDATILQWEYATNGTDVYRLNGNVGIGTSVFTQKLTVSGNVSATQLVSTVASGTAPLVVASDTQVANLNASSLRGKLPPTGTIVGTTDTQTLTNKTLSFSILNSPLLSSAVVSTAGIAFSGSTLGTITLIAPAVATGIATLPTIAVSDTIVARNTTDTLTNKTISASSNTISGLTNANLSGTAGITNANLANSTISGVSLGSNLNNLTAGSYVTYSSGTTYNGSSAITVSVAATSSNTANTIVARNSSGDFTAGTVNVSYAIASQTMQALEFTATSDQNLKDNITTFSNGLETVKSLRGVDFDWKDTQRPSIGVIAQELEQILPALVNSGDFKTVNYNGLVGVLIEAIKELSAEVEDLKQRYK